jgi:serine/threonine-protein kinase RsbW
MGQATGFHGIRVSVPARPENVHLLRVVMSSIAARARFAFEEIDDLRLAIDEACAHLLEAAPAPERIEMRVSLDDRGLEVVAVRDTASDRWPPTGARRTLAWQVLNALTDDVAFEEDRAGPSIRFTKRSALRVD